MEHIFTFHLFLENYIFESYSNLYHYTSPKGIRGILSTNSLLAGEFHDMYSKTRIVSLTRNSNFKEINKNDAACICLDGNKLRQRYKVIPYDYFYWANITKFSKSDTRRDFKIAPFEYEEITTQNIDNLNRYIDYINFLSDDVYNECIDILREYVEKYKVTIKLKNKIMNP